jgi:hypothetical protein
MAPTNARKSPQRFRQASVLILLGAAVLHVSIYARIVVPTVTLNRVLLAFLVCYLVACYVVILRPLEQSDPGPRLSRLSTVVSWYCWACWAVFGALELHSICFPGSQFLGIRPDEVKVFLGAQTLVAMLGCSALQGLSEGGRQSGSSG